MLKQFKVKHEALAAASPLAGMKWTEINATLATADDQDRLSAELHRKPPEATGKRDAKMPAVKDAVRSARDVLMGFNRE